MKPRRTKSAHAPTPARWLEYSSGLDAVRAWFAGNGWTPHPFQEHAWAAYRAGRSGLVHVATGAGKTYAAYGGPLAELIDEAIAGVERAAPPPDGLRLLYITPLRAVSRDIELALARPVRELGLSATVQSRTGDTSASIRARQRDTLPNVLVTTPESLSLLISRENAAALFAQVRCVICDEWHELLSSKRGTQVELAMARLRRFSPGMRTWALSATLDNLEEAAAAAAGVGEGPAFEPLIVSGQIDRPVILESVLPRDPESMPWAGHLGIRMLPEVLERLNPSHSTLVFTNTRSQAERWYQEIVRARPEWGPIAALHHGSIEREERERIEAGLKAGAVRLVVATSSLDLGVDFAPVEEVFQIGSPKGIARLTQRAGRSAHRPGAACRIVCVPTHALEFVEVDAVRRAISAGRIEPRRSLSKPLDVLAQHMVTVALGGGFAPDDLFREVRTAHAYRALARDEFDWTLALVRDGGATLWAYPEYHKVELVDGVYRVVNKRLAQLHRLNVGTITGEATVVVQFRSGRRLGSIEENFITRLKPGETFVFAGRVLEFVTMHELSAIVRPGRGKTNFTPIWGGTKLPISESLGEQVRLSLELAGRGVFDSPELQAARPLVEAQARLSAIPAADEVLIEICRTREGRHLFIYPFDGRLVHGGLGAIVALRLSRMHKLTFSISANDYGVELLTSRAAPIEEMITSELFTTDGLGADAVESVNMAALAKAQFREVARVAGLIFQSYPGARRSGRQVHASSSLLYDVFSEFDPSNLLIEQSRREVLERQFEQGRLFRTFSRLAGAKLRILTPRQPTPLGYPLIIERVGGKLSSQTILERLEAMKEQWTAGPKPQRRSTPLAKKSG